MGSPRTMRAGRGDFVFTIYRPAPSCAAFSVYESCIGPSWANPGGPAGIFDHHLLSLPQRVRRLLTNEAGHLARTCDITRQLGSRQSARTCSFMGSGEEAGAAFGGIALRGPVDFAHA